MSWFQLHLRVGGWKIGGTTVTADAAEINKLNGVTATTGELNTLAGATAGTAVASKALVLDANKDAAGLRNLTLGVNGAGGFAGSLVLKDGASPGSSGTLNLASLTKLAGIAANATANPQQPHIADVAEGADAAAIRTTVNAILAALEAAGILASS